MKLRAIVLVIGWALLLPGWSCAQMTGTISSFGVANYSGFIIASDADPNTGRQAIRARTTMTYATDGSTDVTFDFQLAYHLLDDGGQLVSILDETGQPNTTYSVFQVVTIKATAFDPTSILTSGAPLQPVAALDRYKGYAARLEVSSRPHGSANYGATGVSATESPRSYLTFTNTASPDASANVLLKLESPTFDRTWSIANSSGQKGFPVSVAAQVWRYDDYGVPATTSNVPVLLGFQLFDGAGSPVPLSATQAVVNVTIASHDASTPPAPTFVPVSLDFSVEPAGVRLHSGTSYRLAITLAHLEGGLIISDHTNTLPPASLFDLTGTLLAGPVAANFTSLMGAPLPASPPLYQVAISQNAGSLPGAPGYTFGDGTPVAVSLLDNGDLQLANSAVVPIRGFEGVTQTAHNLSFRRSGLALFAGGAVGTFMLQYPAGFSTSDSGEHHLAAGGIVFPEAVLDGTLAPVGGQLALPGPIFAIAEILPVWIPAASGAWFFNTGQIVLNPGAPVFVRQAEDDLLDTAAALVTEPGSCKRVSNDGYFRNPAPAPGGAPITITADAQGVARIAGQIGLHPPELRPHFPYSGRAAGEEIAIGAEGGVLTLENSQVASAGSFLATGTAVPISYAVSCPDTNCAAADLPHARLAFALSDPLQRFSFTKDGGLLGPGVLTAPASLTWGYAGDGHYAQTTSPVQVGVYHMPGTFLFGDQTALPDPQRPATLLFSGFGTDVETAYLERLGDTYYPTGAANYAGLNFRTLPGATAQSWLGGTETASYPLDRHSKYYVRFGGVSGIHQASPIAAPGMQLSLYGFSFTFTSYGLSYLDSDNYESRTDGAIHFPPRPAGFNQEFERMTFGCRGSLETAQVPASSGPKRLSYWGNLSITPMSIAFSPTSNDTCGTGDRVMVMGIETTLPMIAGKVQATIGFQHTGNLVTPADHAADTDSRFPLPVTLSLKGTGQPGDNFYTVSTAGEGYFNNYFTTGVDQGGSGFFNIPGAIRVPFFSDVRVHLHVGIPSPHSPSTALSVAIAGGWPSPDSQDADRGWSTPGPGGDNFFKNAKFDPASDGWPAAQGVALADYENNRTADQFHPRAQKTWLGTVQFDYPLVWQPDFNSFVGFAPSPVILPVIDVNSTLKELSTGKVDFDFAQDLSLDLPKIKVLDLRNFVQGQVDGALADVESSIQTRVGGLVQGAVGQVLNRAGLSGLQDLLNQDPTSFLKPLLENLLNKGGGPVDILYAALLSNQATLNQTKQQLVQGASLAVSGAGQALQDATATLNGGVSEVNSLAHKIDGVLVDVDDILTSLIDIVKQQLSGKREIVSQIVKRLITDGDPNVVAAAGSIAGGVDDAIAKEVARLEPTLAKVQSELEALQAQIEELDNQIKQADSDFNNALTGAVQGSGLGDFVSLAGGNVSTLIGNADNPAGDFLTADPTAARKAISDQLVTAFLSSGVTGDLQQTLRQFLSEDDLSINHVMDSLFDQVNEAIRNALANITANLPDVLPEGMKGAGDLPKNLLAAKIRGAPIFDHDSLQAIHLNADITLNVPNPITFNASMDLHELNSQSTPVACILEGAPAMEVVLAAQDQPLDWAFPSADGTPITLSANARWTLRGSDVLGIGGSVDVKGKADLESIEIREVGGMFAFGQGANYFEATGSGVIRVPTFPVPLGVKVGFFLGHACDLQPLKNIEADAATVLGNPPDFTGIYVSGGVGFSLSDLLFGGSSCLVDFQADATMTVYYQNLGSPLAFNLGIRQKYSIDGQLLCVLHGSADLSEFGSVHSDINPSSKLFVDASLTIGASADVCGTLGKCPFCLDGCLGVRVTVTAGTGGVAYHLDY